MFLVIYELATMYLLFVSTKSLWCVTYDEGRQVAWMMMDWWFPLTKVTQMKKNPMAMKQHSITWNSRQHHKLDLTYTCTPFLNSNDSPTTHVLPLRLPPHIYSHSPAPHTHLISQSPSPQIHSHPPNSTSFGTRVIRIKQTHISHNVPAEF